MSPPCCISPYHQFILSKEQRSKIRFYSTFHNCTTSRQTFFSRRDNLIFSIMSYVPNTTTSFFSGTVLRLVILRLDTWEIPGTVKFSFRANNSIFNHLSMICLTVLLAGLEGEEG